MSERQRPAAAQPAETHHAPQNDNNATTAIASPDQSGAVAPDANSTAPNPAAPPSKEEVAANSERAERVTPQLGGSVASDSVAPSAPAPVTSGGATGGAVSALPMPTPAPVAEMRVVTPESSEAKTRSGERAAELARLENRPGELDNRAYENRRRERISGPQRNNEQVRNTHPADADDARDRADKQDGTFARNAPPPPAATAAKRTRREMDRGQDETRPAQDAERGEGAGAAAETRNVGGRKFRRQGAAWVDTAYRAGQSQTIVRRNSEQFRALVADEPELRRIAAALGGDVTVVWKGRAYRFR
jgi:hypothetical protein